jgi:hypothetical protein
MEFKHPMVNAPIKHGKRNIVFLLIDNAPHKATRGILQLDQTD